jgi:hypothetical protein
MWNFLTSWVSVGYCISTVLHGVRLLLHVICLWALAVTANIGTLLEELNSDRKLHILLNWCSHYCRKCLLLCWMVKGLKTMRLCTRHLKLSKLWMCELNTFFHWRNFIIFFYKLRKPICKGTWFLHAKSYKQWSVRFSVFMFEEAVRTEGMRWCRIQPCINFHMTKPMLQHICVLKAVISL